MPRPPAPTTGTLLFVELDLLQYWSRIVRRSPAAPAVVDAATGRVWTRQGLEEAAEAWAARAGAVAALGRRRVLMAEPNGSGWFIAFLGLARLGAIPAALDATEPPAERMAVARSIGAAWICHRGELEPVRARPRERRSDLALLKLTSGSTGQPRAHAFTHGQMIADGRQICATMDIRPDDRNLAVIPPGHSYGLGNLVVPLLIQGTTVVCADAPLPHVLAEACSRWQTTVFPAVPTLLQGLVRADVAPAALGSLRVVISAGAPLPAEVAAQFAAKFHRRVHSFYGSSETGGICYDRSGEATLEGRSVGPPLKGVRLVFRQGGRFVVESPAVMRRGRHSPPDRGRLNDRGELVLLGRSGRIVKIAGRRLDLAEVERALRAVPGVRDAFAAAHPSRPDALAAAVAGALSPLALRRALTARIAPWKVPEKLLVLPEFPLTARGKTDTRRLRALLE